MRMFDGKALQLFNRQRVNGARRFLVFPMVALALSLTLIGCSVIKPDFSGGALAESESGRATLQTLDAGLNSAAVDLSPDKGGSQLTESEITTVPAPAQTARSTKPEPPAVPGVATREVTEPAGPLSAILGDNPAQVEPSGAVGDGVAGQLAELTAQEIVEAHDQVLGEIYDQVLPSVVLIRVSRNLGTISQNRGVPNIPGMPEDFFERSGGTGFVWDDQGHIVTNHHVVAEADRLIAVLPDRTELEAEFLGGDPDSDLAVLRVSDPDRLLRPVTLGDSDQVYMGQLAVAMGNPFGQQFSITTGIISGIGRTIRSGNSVFSIPEVLQTDAPINPGNSGGPLLDRKGQVVGVNTQIISRSGVSSGIGFAVPINIAKQVVPAILEDGEYNYSWLGISGSSVTPDIAEAMGLPRSTRGALVIEVVPGSPAAKADLKDSDSAFMLEGRELPIGGDVITAIDGKPVRSIDDVIAFLVGKTQPDQVITMEVIRDGEPEQLTVTLGTRPGS